MNETTHLIKDSLIQDFVFGGNAKFTIKNTISENTITYKVKKLDPSKQRFGYVNKVPSGDMYFVRHHLGYIGHFIVGSYYNKNDYILIPSKKSVVSKQHKVFKVFQKFLTIVANENRIPNKLEVWHEGKCAMCGKKLTEPKSIQDGFGPLCNKRRFLGATSGK